MTIKMQEQFVLFVRQIAQTAIPDNADSAKQMLAPIIEQAKLLEERWLASNR